MDGFPDTVTLSRLQFALTIMFHILWPVATIGLSLFLVFLEVRWIRTGNGRILSPCPVLEPPFFSQRRHRCGHGHSHGVSVRDQLERIRPGRGRFFRAHAGIRSCHGLHAGGQLHRDHDLRVEAGFPRHTPLRHVHGSARGLPVGLLDHGGQFMDADAPGRLLRQREIRRHQPSGGDLQPRHGLERPAYVGCGPRDFPFCRRGAERVVSLSTTGIPAFFSLHSSGPLLPRS